MLKYRTIDNLFKITEKVNNARIAANEPSMEETVRVTLRNCSTAKNYNLCFVSEELNTSERTLSRKLCSEGVSFKSIVEDEKRLLCQELMDSGMMDALELTLNLGFSDPSHFYKKFPLWFGVTFCKYKSGLNFGSSSR